MEEYGITAGVIRKLNDLQIPFMLVGSFSSNYYSFARGTADADFVIEAEGRINDIKEALKPELVMDDQLTFDTIQFSTRFVFQHRSEDFKIEIFLLNNAPHDQERWRRRVHVEWKGMDIWYPTPEDVVVKKLRWGRTKDVVDVQSVISHQRGNFDWSYILRWTDQHGSTDLLYEIMESIPDELLEDRPPARS